MTRDAHILSFDEVRAREAKAPRVVSRSRFQSTSRTLPQGHASRLSHASRWDEALASPSISMPSWLHQESSYEGAGTPSRFVRPERTPQMPSRGFGNQPYQTHGGLAYGKPQSINARRVTREVGKTDAYRVQGSHTHAQNSRRAQGSAHRMPSEGGFGQQIHKRFLSARADRQFDRRYGAQRHTEAVETGQASRAALYEMHQGASARRASRMQQDASRGKKEGASLFSLGGLFTQIGRSALSTRLFAAGVVVLLGIWLLYPACANYYNETRQLQQLQAEYEAVQSYTEQMQAKVDYLSTDEGIEDYARAEYGLVREDEHVVNVEGVHSSSDETTSNDAVYGVASGSVKAPDTWYSGVLDVLFGYAG